jgi:hypothetical protein
MAFTANDNEIFHTRIKNYAVAMQNLREEGKRLNDWYFQEITGSNAFVDTQIATVSEVQAMVNYITAFSNLNESVEVSADARRISLIPFLTNTPA